jgi:DNA primase
VQALARQNGMTIPQERFSPEKHLQVQVNKDEKSKIQEVLAKASRYWQDTLPHSPLALAYLEKRGISQEISKLYQIGYSPNSKHGLTKVIPDYTDPILVESGLVHESEDGQKRDYFRNRIMFPIRDTRGQYIGFGGRILNEGQPKYLNSPETPVFTKGQELYGLFEARKAILKAGYVLVTEGYMDVIALAQLGFGHTVATLGTACTAQHIQKILRFTEKIVFAFDGDTAGVKAAEKALHLSLPYAKDGRSIHFLFLPTGHDPDSFIRTQGSDAFSHAVTSSLPLSQMFLQTIRKGCDIETIEGRSRLVTQAKGLWPSLPKGFGKQEILKEIATLAQLHPKELLSLWSNQNSHPKNKIMTPWKSMSKTSPSSDFTFRQRYDDTKNLGQQNHFAYHRLLPTERMQRALGMFFANPHYWERLSQSDHDMFCHWEKPYGILFTWLDRYLHEYGPQPWSILRIAIKNETELQTTYTLIQKAVLQVLDKEIEESEIQDILQRLRQEWRKKRLETLAKASSSDPTMYANYKALLAEVQNK